MIEQQQRLAIVAESRKWIGTPYHHKAAVRGAGVDCAMLIMESFVGAGVMERFDVGSYTCDWHLHRGEERYIQNLETFSVQVSPPGDLSAKESGLMYDPATILMFRVGRTFSHSALVTEWPFVVHSYLPSRVVEEVDLRGTPMADRPMRAFSFWDFGK